MTERRVQRETLDPPGRANYAVRGNVRKYKLILFDIDYDEVRHKTFQTRKLSEEILNFIFLINKSTGHFPKTESIFSSVWYFFFYSNLSVTRLSPSVALFKLSNEIALARCCCVWTWLVWIWLSFCKNFIIWKWLYVTYLISLLRFFARFLCFSDICKHFVPPLTAIRPMHFATKITGDHEERPNEKSN